MNAKVLLIGCGAEIGSSLLGMNSPDQDQFQITDVYTNPIESDPKHPHLSPLDSLIARIIISQPELLDHVSANYEANQLIIKKKTINIHWGDVYDKEIFDKLKTPFDLIILATSKKHIADHELTQFLSSKAKWVVGVAEANNIPALYPNLIGVKSSFLPNQPRPVGKNRVFALGSCQSNGWQAQLRPLIEINDFVDSFKMLGMEIDIVHPDTPTGRLGTKSIEARSQDPRNNLRPSFSQIERSMKLLFPGVHAVNTVSLRTLIHPPGYQICRFIFQYQGKELSQKTLLDFYRNCAKKFPYTLRIAELPFGSRGYEYAEASAVVLASEKFFRYYDNPLKLQLEKPLKFGQLITQSYVNNVRGYCRSVLQACRYLITEQSPMCFEELNL